jgi:hypothetical protein
MRFIIKEQPYERLVSAGQYRYEIENKPTGAVESWRVTAVTDGYQFLRVDLDAREAKSGHSYLYHAVVNPAEEVERLKFRFWGAGLEIVGDVVLEETAVSVTRTINNETFADVLTPPKGYRFWFPSVAGLHFAGWRGNDPKTAVTLNGQIGGPDTLAAQVVEFEYYPLITDYMEMEVAGKMRQYSPWRIAWDDGFWRVIMRDAELGWPIGMERMGLDGSGRLTAVAVYYIQYLNSR